MLRVHLTKKGSSQRIEQETTNATHMTKAACDNREGDSCRLRVPMPLFLSGLQRTNKSFGFLRLFFFFFFFSVLRLKYVSVYQRELRCRAEGSSWRTCERVGGADYGLHRDSIKKVKK